MREAAARRPVAPPSPADKVPVTAVVAVGTGEGIHRIFYSLGASTPRRRRPVDEPLDPRHPRGRSGDAGATRSSCCRTTRTSSRSPGRRRNSPRRRSSSSPTRGVQEGFAALLEYDPSSSGADNARLMEEAARRVVAGEVTRAVRATTCAAGKVAVGDFIGLSRAGIESVGKGLADATIGLLAALLGPGHEIVTLVQGEGSTAAETRRRHRMAPRGASRGHGGAAPRRPTPLPVPRVDRVSSTPSGRKLGQLEKLPVSELRWVGNRKRAALESMGICSVLDLLTHYPRRYADRTNAVSIRRARARRRRRRLGDGAARVAAAPAGAPQHRRGRRRRRHRRAAA